MAGRRGRHRHLTAVDNPVDSPRPGDPPAATSPATAAQQPAPYVAPEVPEGAYALPVRFTCAPGDAVFLDSATDEHAPPVRIGTILGWRMTEDRSELIVLADPPLPPGEPDAP